jgi:2-polyprenyl-3-methyl-5-hydroxy-6-metoxy-1,4-benzoquinol methylase
MVSSLVKKNQTILDVGSGYGFFLREMSGLGYKITGIEISQERRKISARVTKTKVLDIDLLEDTAGLPKFDCLTLFHSLEHILDPVSFLKILKKHLNRNGKLIIEVPNADDLLLGASEGYRNFYWQRAHLFYFNAKTLKKIIQKAGLSIIGLSYVQRYSLENFMNWFILGQPQLQKPVFQTRSEYQWLEDYYKKYLSKTGKSDTLILIAKP